MSTSKTYVPAAAVLVFGAAAGIGLVVQWNPTALADDAGGALVQDGGHPVSGVFIDSRQPIAGALFVPIVAARDGHDFIQAAIDGGAAAVLVRKGFSVENPGVTVVEVDDTLDAFGRLARARCAAFEGPVVTISGSNGKTTTRAMVAAVLAAAFDPVLCTAGNLNNHLGVPLTVLGGPHRPEAMVVELGMSAPGENDHLAALTQPTAHVITSVALEHLEFMKTIEAIAAAEAEPVARVRAGGIVVAPSDEPLLRPHLPKHGPTVLSFGSVATDRVEILDVEVGARTVAKLRIGRETATIRLQLFGAHNARNAAAALAVGDHLGIPVPAMVAALERVEPVGDRGRTHALGDHLLVADCYNSNPGSVEVALASLARLRSDRSGPLVAVLGDMLELGPTEDELHAATGRRAAELGLDAVVGFGSLSLRTVEAAASAGIRAAHCADIASLEAEVRRLVEPGAPGAVLVKGSRGMKLERLVTALLE